MKMKCKLLFVASGKSLCLNSCSLNLLKNKIFPNNPVELLIASFLTEWSCLSSMGMFTQKLRYVVGNDVCDNLMSRRSLQ